jgi:hypothetical protein
MNEFSTSGGNTTGRNIELIGDQTKRNYLWDMILNHL